MVIYVQLYNIRTAAAKDGISVTTYYRGESLLRGN